MYGPTVVNEMFRNWPANSFPASAVYPANLERLRCCLQRTSLPPRLLHPCGAAAIRALVIVAVVIVQCLNFAPSPSAADRKSGQNPPKIERNESKLPRLAITDLPIPVLEMRDAILIATHSGNIEDLRTAIEWNELPPEFGFDHSLDPIEQFRKISTDGKGHSILAILANLLAQAPAQLPIGPDHENNGVFVWPYLSELDPGKLTPAEQVDLYRLMPANEAEEVMKQEKWTWYRLAIAADGTWHIFSK